MDQLREKLETPKQLTIIFFLLKVGEKNIVIIIFDQGDVLL